MGNKVKSISLYFNGNITKYGALQVDAVQWIDALSILITVWVMRKALIDFI